VEGVGEGEAPELTTGGTRTRDRVALAEGSDVEGGLCETPVLNELNVSRAEERGGRGGGLSEASPEANGSTTIPV